MKKTFKAAILSSNNSKLSFYPDGENIVIIIEKKKTKDAMTMSKEDWDRFVVQIEDLVKESK